MLPEMKTLWILGDQLNKEMEGFLRIDPKRDVVLMIQSRDRSLWKAEHKQKLVLAFSAMGHFVMELKAEGYTVDYREAENFSEGLKEHFSEFNSRECLIHRPTDQRIRTMIEKEGAKYEEITFEILSERPLFLVEKKQWDKYLPKGKPWKQDEVYRKLRKEWKILMEEDRPLGGKWSYDSENRKPPGKGLSFPAPLTFQPDRITRDMMKKVEKEYPDHFGELNSFSWPVTREGALQALEQFIDERLVTFGDYQDAMIEGNPLMSHSLLSGAVNLGLLTPEEVIRRAERAYHEKKAPLTAVEGFIRQISGWREYIRGVYLRRMPEYEQVNKLNHNNHLPAYYWTAETKLNCVKTAVREVRENGYNHHIQRLMVLGNWANLIRVKPQEVSEWFLEAYVDAYDWVVLPNVLGMALYADGGVMSTKPYVSSGQYIHRMSNYCENCHYIIKEKLREKACPFHALYWTFLEDHRENLQGNPRMRLMYANWDRQKEEQREGLLERGRKLLKEAEKEKKYR